MDLPTSKTYTMKIKSYLRKLFRKPAILLVTIYANHIYRQGVDAAERRHALEGNIIYLAANAFRPDHLVTYNKAQFKIEKRVYGIHARLLTMNTLRRGCYYHTSDRFEANGMSERDKEIRRKAFIRERLRLAKLI